MCGHVHHSKAMAVEESCHRDPLHFNKVRLGALQQLSPLRRSRHVLTPQKGQTTDRAFRSGCQDVHRLQVSLPEILEQRLPHGFQLLWSCTITGQIELSHLIQSRDGLRKLAVRHQKRGDPTTVKGCKEFIDAWVCHRLTHQ